MKCFEYKISTSVYDEIISGRKTIEFRLLNEKSESIKIGDKIKFKILDNEEKYILVEVINKYIFDNIDDLWNSKEYLSNTLNYTKKELTEAFNTIFGEKNVNNSQIVGIEFKIKN